MSEGKQTLVRVMCVTTEIPGLTEEENDLQIEDEGPGCGWEGNSYVIEENGMSFFQVEECPDCGGPVEEVADAGD